MKRGRGGRREWRRALFSHFLSFSPFLALDYINLCPLWPFCFLCFSTLYRKVYAFFLFYLFIRVRRKKRNGIRGVGGELASCNPKAIMTSVVEGPCHEMCML